MDGDLAFSDGCDIEVEKGDVAGILDGNDEEICEFDQPQIRDNVEQWMQNYLSNSVTDLIDDDDKFLGPNRFLPRAFYVCHP
jgi:hypothetical protein